LIGFLVLKAFIFSQKEKKKKKTPVVLGEFDDRV
jgi:hypothetical protein